MFRFDRRTEGKKGFDLCVLPCFVREKEKIRIAVSWKEMVWEVMAQSMSHVD